MSHVDPGEPGPHLVVDVTGHGFGHLGQLAPILSELRRRRTGLRLTLRTALPADQLGRMLEAPFARAPGPPDIGLVMASPIEPDRPATRAFYDRLEGAWEELVAEDAAQLQALRPDLLIANVGALGLAAAVRAGIPALALSSLDWASVLEAYDLASAALVSRLREAYSAVPFVQLTPHLPMEWHPDRHPVGPVARRGRRRREELLARLALPETTILALVAFGGIAMPRPLRELPALSEVAWLADRTGGPGLVPVDGLDLPFPDLLASVDLLVTKTGYGLMVEAAVAGTPVLYLARPDWPEAPWLEGWVTGLGLGAPLPTDAQAVAAAVDRLGRGPRLAPVEPTGIAQAVAIIERRLDQG